MATSPAPRPILIEPGGYDDLDAVMAVMDAAFSPCFGEGWSRSQVAGILPLQGVRMVVARVSERQKPVVGFALWRTITDESELLLLAVHPGAQRCGLGEQLLEAFLRGGMMEDVKRMHLEVRDGNIATRLYERAGFLLAGRRREYYRGKQGERHDALTYVKISE